MSRCYSQLLLRTQKNTVLPFSEVWYHLLICGFSWPIRDPRSRATKTPKSKIPVLQERHEPDVGHGEGGCRQHSDARMT